MMTTTITFSLGRLKILRFHRLGDVEGLVEGAFLGLAVRCTPQRAFDGLRKETSTVTTTTEASDATKLLDPGFEASVGLIVYDVADPTEKRTGLSCISDDNKRGKSGGK